MCVKPRYGGSEQSAAVLLSVLRRYASGAHAVYTINRQINWANTHTQTHTGDTHRQAIPRPPANKGRSLRTHITASLIVAMLSLPMNQLCPH